MTAERLNPVTAIPRSLPLSTNGIISGSGFTMSCMRPLIKSTMPCIEPLYGTCWMSMPADALNNSPPRCDDVPLPAEGNSSWPGRRFASAMTSLTVFAGSAGCTTMSSGAEEIRITGARSLSGS